MAATLAQMQHETALAPHVVADCVIREVEAAVGVQITNGRELADALAYRAEYIYFHNKRWAGLLRRKDGREWLYAFMRHWLASELLTNHPEIYRKLHYSFANGAPAQRRA